MSSSYIASDASVSITSAALVGNHDGRLHLGDDVLPVIVFSLKRNAPLAIGVYAVSELNQRGFVVQLNFDFQVLGSRRPAQKSFLTAQGVIQK